MGFESPLQREILERGPLSYDCTFREPLPEFPFPFPLCLVLVFGLAFGLTTFVFAFILTFGSIFNDLFRSSVWYLLL